MENLVAWFELRLFRALKQNDLGQRPSPPSELRRNVAKSDRNYVVGLPSTQELPKKKPTPDIHDNLSPHKPPVTNTDNQQLPKPPPKPELKATSVDVKKPPPPKYDTFDFQNCTLLRPDDVIYTYGPWDGSPIVILSHKLIFFTIPKVGCTVWKQLFRRMMGYQDWIRDRHPLPHAPPRNGLMYLYDYPPAIADQMMMDPSWTRAIFLRDPKERLLSAYLDKGRQNQYVQYHCCKYTQPTEALHVKLQCDQKQAHLGPAASQSDTTPPLITFTDFLTLLVPKCPDPHWNPQSNRIDAKYWPYINFVGHMDSMEHDAKRLLQRCNAWDEYGNAGWPPNGTIFGGSLTVSHATDSSNHLRTYFTPDVEDIADSMVRSDYEIPVLGMEMKRFFRAEKKH